MNTQPIRPRQELRLECLDSLAWYLKIDHEVAARIFLSRFDEAISSGLWEPSWDGLPEIIIGKMWNEAYHSGTLEELNRS
jgi:hypothetical protein